MVTQLYDVAMDVCEAAVMYLEELCVNAEGLNKAVKLRPSLEHLGDVGYPLFMRYAFFGPRSVFQLKICRFVSTSTGFAYLYEAQHVDREMESWIRVSLITTGFTLS